MCGGGIFFMYMGRNGSTSHGQKFTEENIIRKVNLRNGGRHMAFLERRKLKKQLVI